VRLASQLGSGLVGVLYILDEPSVGLHSRDQRQLLDTLIQLRDYGNTVLVVEHDAETIRTADWVIDMGPGAGALGGAVIAVGTTVRLLEDIHRPPRLCQPALEMSETTVLYPDDPPIPPPSGAGVRIPWGHEPL
jgi:energy-coupling factor transporter ATP-binding protein EcfA2